MVATRTSVMRLPIVLTILFAVVMHAKDAKKLEYEDLLTTTESYARLRIYKETTERDDQIRNTMSSTTEVPTIETLSSKAKREQVLRNILAARRRRISKQRSGRPIQIVSKDPPDILEAQETKQGVYATVVSVGNVSDADKTMEENLTTLTNEREDTESTMSVTITMTPVTSVPKLSENDNSRKKNTVSMPESLYKHFRPVESNIPMEDMSQFLYFGQKLQPELQNVTTINNESTGMVSTGIMSTGIVSTTPGSSRRRTIVKKLGSSTTSTTSTTSTASTTLRADEISNDDETNLALERRMIEKNKVSKTKSTLRDASSSYYRKTRLSDSTIATNVIPSKDIAHNGNSTEVVEELKDSGGGGGERNSSEDALRKSKTSRTSFRRSKKMEDSAERSDNVRVIDEYRSKEDKNSRESNSIDESASRSTTLRIIVAEPETTNSADDFSTATTTITSEQPRRHQQQHVYAYTITNVTRLLRNYSGSSHDRGRGRGLVVVSPRRSNSTGEITNAKVPLESPEAEAATGTQASAGAAAEEPSRDFVGGLSTGRNVEEAGGTSTIIVPVAATTTTIATTTNTITVGAGGAGAAGASSFLVGERRRKVLASGAAAHRAAANAAAAQSAPQRAPVRISSAVIRSRHHHWPDRVTTVDTATSTTNDQRMVFQRKKSNPALEGPNLKQPTPEPFRMPSKATRDSVLLDADRRNSLQTDRPEDERPDNEVTVKSIEENERESTKAFNTEESTTVLVDLASFLPSPSTEEINDNFTEGTTEGLPSFDTKDDENFTTTEPPSRVPVFPVTPKLLVNATSSSDHPDKKQIPITTTDSLNQVTQNRRPDQDRPFGIAADLDPSEIQKMYRSNSSSTETTVQTTPETITTFASLPPIRSAPENRGRSLSDKTKQEDDVLPIMQLYNTSDIFDEGSTLGPATRTVELPVEENDANGHSTASQIPSTPSPPPTRATVTKPTPKPNPKSAPKATTIAASSFVNRTRYKSNNSSRSVVPDYTGPGYQPVEFNRTFLDNGSIAVSPRESVNISEVISKRHDGDAIASQETVAVVSYILATLVVFPIAVGVGLILRRLIIRNRKVLEESDTSSEISCRKDALNLENGDFKTSIEKAITKLPRIQHLCHEAEKPPPPPPSQESRWEFPRDKLRLQTVLGQGNFGQVWKAEADDLTGHQGTTRLVAVKTVKEGASEREKEDLVRELEIMQQLGSHPNVVTLLGCCTEEEPHYLILEYVMYGKLLAYLRDHRTRQDFYNFSEDSAALTSRDLTVFGYCVARGMEYLASKKIIHRDLAARNVLVDHNKLCKIADFGMSRFANEDGEVIETRHGRNALPIRWMAPESLIYSLFTTKTDVWSFGILMWEIVTLGSTPYPDMTAREVMRNVQSGYRLERPSHCRSELFRVISRCWHADPDRRPEFQILRRDLAQLLEDNMNGHYVDLESFASECTD